MKQRKRKIVIGKEKGTKMFISVVGKIALWPHGLGERGVQCEVRKTRRPRESPAALRVPALVRRLRAENEARSVSQPPLSSQPSFRGTSPGTCHPWEEVCGQSLQAKDAPLACRMLGWKKPKARGREASL